MHVTAKGALTKKVAPPQAHGHKAQPVFAKVKDINSIYLANAVKTDAGYMFSTESMSKTAKQLITYLKQHP